ncbi:F-box protein At3g07870 [Capsicum annuum]|uniref:F-box protein At3g07870 n=1 Tax=Capsicum annuum TaxID=4072 RepID=UPI0007BEC647|nr:F-box protein At3g07870 [Capsicum annuum]
MEAKNLKRKRSKLFALFNPLLRFFKHKHRRTRFVDLPRVIIVEILSILSIESMLSSRCVCKLWYNFFSDPLFLTMYKSRSPPPCILFSRDHDISQLLELEPHCNDYSSRLHNRPILLSCPEFNTLVKRRMDILVEDYPVLRLIGSCNGFIGFMTNIYDINASIYISDPLLGEYFKLILSELEKSVCRVAYGFCFSEVSGRYKLVRSVTKSFGGHLEVSELEVCILGVDEKWRNWGQVPYPVWQDFGQVCVNGALHWMDPINKDNIYSFDIKTEKLKSVPGSPGLVFPFKHLTQAELVRSRRPPSGLTLVELVNCLCLTDDGGSSFGIYGG